MEATFLKLSIYFDQKVTSQVFKLSKYGFRYSALVNLSNLDQNTNNLDWGLMKSLVHQALVEFGCFEATFANIKATFANIPLELQTSMFDSSQMLFDLPLQTKLKNQSSKPFDGYVGQYPNAPLYESMGIEDARIHENVGSFAKSFWPQGNPKFCKPIQEFSEKLSKLDQMVRMMVLESLGLEKYMDEHIGSTSYHLRFIKYKGLKTNEFEVGLKSHTDKNIITILHQNQVNGLEVQSKCGKWIKVQPSPNSFIVMVGDSFYAWTNGLLYSPYHRVVMSGEKARYSFGLCSMPKAGYVVKAPTEVVDEEHPLLFKLFDYAEYAEFLQFYSTEAGRRAQYVLKTYCGV